MSVARFYTDLAETGSRAGNPLSAKSVRNTHVVPRKALADAGRLGLVPRNAAAAAKPPAVQAVEHQTWDSDQLIQFFEHVSDDRFFAAYVLAATTGVRRGEVLGLRVCPRSEHLLGGRRRARKVHGIRWYAVGRDGHGGRHGLFGQLRANEADGTARPERPR